MNYYNNQNGANFQNDYYTQLMQARRQEKRSMFINVSKLGIILLLYNFLNSVFLNIYYLLVYAYKNKSFTFNLYTAKKYLSTQKALIESSTFSMAGNLFIICSSLIIILIVSKFIMKINLSEMMKPKKNDLGQAVKWFPLSMTLNVFVGIIISYFTLYMQQVGVTVPEADLSIRQPTRMAIILQIAYVVVLGPIAEEIIYRGLILTLLKPYGKFLSVFVSALIFGVMHGNIAQAASAFASALVFATIAVQCNSIIPTIIIHIANNAFASFLDIAEIYNWPYAKEIYMGLQMFILLMGVFALLVNGWKLRFKNDSNYALTSGQRYACVFTNVFMIVYFLYMAYEFISSFIIANM